MEQRYVRGQLKPELYEKYDTSYRENVAILRQKLENNSIDSSNLNKVIKKGLFLAKNLSQIWITADFTEKQKLQRLVFPEGILYSKENDTVRTPKINALFAEIPLLKRVIAGKKKGNLNEDCLKSRSVPETGIEPAHSYERQILSLLRLPIPPPGQQ